MTGRTLSSAAAVCGLPDPMEIADRLSALPTAEVGACSHYAGALAVSLFQGAHTAQDAAALTGRAWSTGTAAVTAIGQTGMAAMSARSVLTDLSGALDGVRATMQQVETLAHPVVADAEAALQQAGFDAATGRASSAPVTGSPFPLSSPTGTTVDGTPGVLTPIVAAALDRLRGLQARLDAAVEELVPTTRTDPRDLLQRLPARAPSPTPAGTGLADAALDGAAALTGTVAATVGALGAVAGGLLARGAAGASARAGLAVTDAVRAAVTTAGAAVSDRVAAARDSLAASVTSVPATAAASDADARARLAADLGSTDPATSRRAEHIQAALDRAAAAGQTVQLLAYTPATSTSQGSAAIGIGDMGTADSVTTMVPGVFNSADDMSGALGEAERLQTEAHRRSPGGSTAVVAWFGYDVPATTGYTPDRVGNIGSATDDQAAVAGAAALKADLSRFRQYAPDTARQVVVGHSMGSVVVSAAAAQGAVIDDLVLVGSPGASRLADSARDYPHVAPGHTWVLALDDPVTRPEIDGLAGAADALSKLSRLASLDPRVKVELLGDLVTDPPGSQFGPDPAAADFGATQIDPGTDGSPTSPGGVLEALAPPAAWGARMGNHFTSSYFSGSALTAIADITAGHAADVRTKPGR